MTEGQKCLDEEKWEEAVHLYGEAELMDSWKDVHGGQILASLAYVFA